MRNILLLISILLTAVSASSQPRFTYDVDYEMNFDNREYSPSKFSKSMTIFGARLTPAVGLEVCQPDSTNHKLMSGVDVMKDFGASPVSENLAGGQTDETAQSLDNFSLFRERHILEKNKK